MMKRKAAARLRAAPVPPFRVNGWGDFLYAEAAFAFFRNPTNLALRRGGGPPAGGSVPARIPRRNFLCGRSLYQLVPFLWSTCHFCETKKSPPHGGTVLTPAEAKFRGGGAAPLLV